ncbi:hypothetical protein [Nonomuraea sp. NPDC002799]
MAEESVLYDSPVEFMQNVASANGACVAQSVMPEEDGSYVCACSCDEWLVTASTRDEGLHLCRLHTGSVTGADGSRSALISH